MQLQKLQTLQQQATLKIIKHYSSNRYSVVYHLLDILAHLQSMNDGIKNDAYSDDVCSNMC